MSNVDMEKIEEFKDFAKLTMGLDVIIRGRERIIPVNKDIVIHLEDTGILIDSVNPVIDYTEDRDFFELLRKRSDKFEGRDEHYFLMLLSNCLEKEVKVVYNNFE